MNLRAYSILEVKDADDSKRIVEGVASTPSTDRMGDIVEPLGAVVANGYVPFLWQHEGREAAVGEVIWSKPTKAGIPVRIRIESDDQPGILKDRLDYAYRSIKKRLVRGLSIGFRSLKAEPIKGGGLRFLLWEWLELSAVTIPAQAEATIQVVRSIDTRLRSGTARTSDLRGARYLEGGLVVPDGSMKLHVGGSRNLLPPGSRATPKARNLGSRKLWGS